MRRELKQERAERTREEILDAAIKLFARRGFLATTMSELAKSIRMTPGALYWHFQTKEDLLLAAIDALNARYVEVFSDLVTEGRHLSARGQLVAFLLRTQDFLRTQREYGVFFGMVAAESAEQHERVASALRQALGRYVSVVAGIIRYGQTRTNEFRTDLDATMLAHALIAAHQGILIHQRLHENQADYDALVNTLDVALLDGILRQR